MLQGPSEGFAAVTEKRFSMMSNPEVCCIGSSGELLPSNLADVRGKYWVESNSP